MIPASNGALAATGGWGLIAVTRTLRDQISGG
jgi:hypothetical protein